MGAIDKGGALLDSVLHVALLDRFTGVEKLRRVFSRAYMGGG